MIFSIPPIQRIIFSLICLPISSQFLTVGMRVTHQVIHYPFISLLEGDCQKLKSVLAVVLCIAGTGGVDYNCNTVACVCYDTNPSLEGFDQGVYLPGSARPAD